MCSLHLKASVLLLVIAGLYGPAIAGTSPGSAANAEATPAHRVTALPAALRPALYRALAKDAGSTYWVQADGCATLPKSALKACFDDHGVHFSGAGSLALHLTAWGRGDQLAAVKAVKPVIKGSQVTYGHGNLSEWWRGLPMGFEQGFTIAKRPAGHGKLTLALVASRQNAGAPSLRHSRAKPAPAKAGGGNPVETMPFPPSERRGTEGDVLTELRVPLRGPAMTKKVNALAWGQLRYGQLVVTDAGGKVIPATLKSKGNRILIAVNDAHAAYPLTVDPLVWLEQKVIANDGAANDNFGGSVAISGATALVGAPAATVHGNQYQGAAYVFSDAGGTWTQVAKLTASDGSVSDEFGWSVALIGTTALVGASTANVNGNLSQGAAYIFTESGGTWGQTAKLTANDGAPNDEFGSAVALSGTTAFVGANQASVNGNTGQGAAYIFTKSNGMWTQTQKLAASDGTANDSFGYAVALVGGTAFVGAPDADINGTQDRGAVYVFTKYNDTWTQTQKLITSDGAEYDRFGCSVALSSTAAFIGTLNNIDNGNVEPGIAYVFTESGGSWSQLQELTASDGAPYDSFGYSIAVSDMTALIGAPGATVNGNFSQGAAYVFAESGDTWTQTVKLAASDGTEDDAFGRRLALSGTASLIGAFHANINGNTQQGAAYFYDLSNFGLAVTTPQTVKRGQNYTSQTIATNNASAASPAVAVTMAVPAAASFVSAMASQGSCSEDSNVVTCDFGAIDGNAGTATANVTLKATGDVGAIIENTASVSSATPPLTSSAPTAITGGCPGGYTEYDGHLDAGKRAAAPPYQSPAGRENAILTAPAGFRLYVLFQNAHGRKLYRIPGHEIHRRAPAGTFTWIVKAGNQGGAYTLCLLHP